MTGRTRPASAMLTSRRHVDLLRVSSAVCRAI
ncbi:putative leader peptide [Cryptosporangium arvum]